jgi:2-polyprenyl-3-methyl-5-hydroxy-6-metoxy-1,4-benzoquinol methylase
LNSVRIGITVLDLSIFVRDYARKLNMITQISKINLKTSSTFKTIALSYVIEHVSNPSKLIRDPHGSLAPQEKLFVTTPDGTTPGLLDSSLAWPPHHMIAFSPKALRDLMKSAEFSNLEVFRNPNLADAAFDFLVVGTN